MLYLIPAPSPQHSCSLITTYFTPIILNIFSQTRIINARSSQFDRQTRICTCGVSPVPPVLMDNLDRSHITPGTAAHRLTSPEPQTLSARIGGGGGGSNEMVLAS